MPMIPTDERELRAFALQGLTPEEAAALRGKLNALLISKAHAYTLGDSTSLPRETAGELLASLLYTLGVNPNLPETYRPLLDKDIRALYGARLHRLEERTKCAKALAAALCLATPNIGCVALTSTLSGIVQALPAYDMRFFAHRVPGEIDYQLISPVPDTLLGVDYTLEYLTRLQTELRFLSRFPLHRVLSLLDGMSSRWRELVCNLCAPAATNALGLALLGNDPRRLHLSQAQRGELLDRLRPCSPAQLLTTLNSARRTLRVTLALTGEEDALLAALCGDLAPRLACAVQKGDLSHVFFSFGLPRRSKAAKG